jgi:glycosyltransferase involved in cell wall biosynthesis
MEIIVLDNGLRGRGEHSYQLLLEICNALSRRGIGHRVFGAKWMDRAIMADIGAIPHFYSNLYKGKFPPVHEFIPNIWALSQDFMGGRSIYSEERTWRLLNKTYQRDLGRLPADIWKRENLIVVPAISQNQICGLIRHLMSLPSDARPKVVCHLMFTPSWTPWGRNGLLGEAYYREAFLLAGGLIDQSLFFTTENDALAEVYREQFKIDTTILPIPLGIFWPTPTKAKKVRLGFFGYSKTEKGFHLLPEAIEICRAKKLPIEFTVQIQHSNWEKETVATERQLRRMADVELIEGTMSTADYAQKTNAVDVTLLPYDPERFGPRGSGLFTEAVAAGRPIIAAQGIYAATSIKRGEAEGEIFFPYDAAALAAAIERLLPRLAECQARAAERADTFARRHSGDTYADVLLGFLKLRSA